MAVAEPLPFEEVYRLYAKPIFKFCVSQLGDVSAAEDVAGDVFVAAFAAYPRVRPEPDGVCFWLLRIARNRAINHRRRAARWRGIVSSLRYEERSTATANVEAAAIAGEELREVLTALRTLGKRDRLLVGLRYAADLSFADIGRMLGMSEKSAATATYRALDRVRQKTVGASCDTTS